MATDAPQHLSLAEVADRLGVCIKSARKYARVAGVGFIHEPAAGGRWGRVLIAAEDLARIVEAAGIVPAGTSRESADGLRGKPQEEAGEVAGASTPFPREAGEIPADGAYERAIVPAAALARFTTAIEQLAAAINSHVDAVRQAEQSRAQKLAAVRDRARTFRQETARGAGGSLYLLATVSAVVVVSLGVMLGLVGPP